MLAATATTPVSTASMMPGRHPFCFSMLAHARLPSASWSLDSDESLRSEPQSHLASRPAFARCKPISNKHTHSAWTFAHALGTAVQSTHQQYPLPIVSPPQSQDTIHTHDTRIESSGLRNDMHTRETHTSGSQPHVLLPPYNRDQAGWHAPSPDRLPKTTPWFRLGETTTPNGTMDRGAPCTKFLSYATHGPDRITAWLKRLNPRILEATHVVGKNSSSSPCLAWEPVAPRSQTLALVREASTKCNRLGEKYSTAGYVRAPMRL